jgi:hypothetical protein
VVVVYEVLHDQHSLNEAGLTGTDVDSKCHVKQQPDDDDGSKGARQFRDAKGLQSEEHDENSARGADDDVQRNTRVDHAESYVPLDVQS